jgi:hypothetical protein
VDQDRLFLDWVRHYAILIGLFVVLGVVGGVGFVVLSPPKVEAWSVVVQVKDRIPPIQLGTVAQSVFRTADVYRPAFAELGVTVPPQDFYETQTELRPVPDTDAVIVIGRSEEEDRALAISQAMARAFIEAFEAEELSQLSLFGRAAPVSPGIGTKVALALGGTVGFWIGLAASLLHYRAKRPLLTLQRAMSVTGADHVTLVGTGNGSWLGALRRPFSADGLERDRSAWTGLIAGWPPEVVPSVVVATGNRRDAARLEDRLDQVLRAGVVGRTPRPAGPAGPLVVVAGPSTPQIRLERATAEASGVPLHRADRVELVWVR